MAQPRNRTAQHPPPFSPFRPAPLGPLAAQPHSSRTSPLPRGPAWHRDPQLPRLSAPSSSHCALAPFVSAHSLTPTAARAVRSPSLPAGPACQSAPSPSPFPFFPVSSFLSRAPPTSSSAPPMAQPHMVSHRRRCFYKASRPRPFGKRPISPAPLPSM